MSDHEHNERIRTNGPSLGWFLLACCVIMFLMINGIAWLLKGL